MNGTMIDLMFDLQVAIEGSNKDAQEQRWNSDDFGE